MKKARTPRFWGDYGYRALDLDGGVGPGTPNDIWDTSRTDAALHKTGYLDTPRAEARKRDRAIRTFQVDHGLVPDGRLAPDGPTVMTLEHQANRAGSPWAFDRGWPTPHGDLFDLHGPVGRDGHNHPDDLFRIGSLLYRTGDLPGSVRTVTPAGAARALRSYQWREGLQVDGHARPGGPTLNALWADIAPIANNRHPVRFSSPGPGMGRALPAPPPLPSLPSLDELFDLDAWSPTPPGPASAPTGPAAPEPPSYRFAPGPHRETYIASVNELRLTALDDTAGGQRHERRGGRRTQEANQDAVAAANKAAQEAGRIVNDVDEKCGIEIDHEGGAYTQNVRKYLKEHYIGVVKDGKREVSYMDLTFKCIFKIRKDDGDQLYHRLHINTATSSGKVDEKGMKPVRREVDQATRASDLCRTRAAADQGKEGSDIQVLIPKPPKGYAYDLDELARFLQPFFEKLWRRCRNTKLGIQQNIKDKPFHHPKRNETQRLFRKALGR